MSKYYLIRGFQVALLHDGRSISTAFSSSNRSKLYSYKKEGKILPQNYTLIKIDSKIAIKIVYCNIDVGFFLVQAPSRRIGYYFVNAILNFYDIYSTGQFLIMMVITLF